MHYQVKPSTLQGNIVIPASKSHTLRAILFASFANGNSVIQDYLPSPDTEAMIHACRLLGANITTHQHSLTITGMNGKPTIPANIIDAGNSGQVLRFIGAVTALMPAYTVITGDHSIRSNRPVQPLLDGLNQLGVFAISTNNNGFAPIIIKGPLQGGITTLDGQDSQPVSGLLIAAAFAKKKTIIQVKNPGEKPWINLTLQWFKQLGIDYQQQHYTQYIVAGNTTYGGFNYHVPGDFSSCAYPLVAALITQSEIVLNNLDMNDSQGDKVLIPILQQMGALIDIETNKKIVRVRKTHQLVGIKINLNDCIDAIPILAVLSCFAQTDTIITGAAIARRKESDRLAVITSQLNKMGANISELADGLIIHPAELIGTRVSSYHDHRIAMALTIAALKAKGETIIENIACIDKSYPNFMLALQQLGACITVHQ